MTDRFWNRELLPGMPEKLAVAAEIVTSGSMVYFRQRRGHSAAFHHRAYPPARRRLI